MKRRKGRLPPLTGALTVPGDKSISHRALILGALAPGPGRVAGINVGADVRATAAALSALGARCTIETDEALAQVEGCGWAGLKEPDGVIDAGNSGTTIRTLLGLAATIEGTSVFTGDASLRQRPMLRVVAPLRQMGAAVDGRRNGEFPPLSVRGGGLTGLSIDLPVASAQVKTALLLAGLRAEGTTEISEPHQSRDHTERMLAAAGAPIARDGLTVRITAGWEPTPIDRSIPGDVSSALYLAVGALLVDGSHIELAGVGLNETRSAALDALRAMGGRVEVTSGTSIEDEPAGTISVTSSDLAGIEIDPTDVPRLIDDIPVLAIAATQAEGTTVITGAAELRVKESNRIEGLVAGLTTLGAKVEALPDGLVITGPTPLTGGEVDSRGDHRLALAFAIAGLVASERVRVLGWSCVDTSFPEFLDLLGRAQSAKKKR